MDLLIIRTCDSHESILRGARERVLNRDTGFHRRYSLRARAAECAQKKNAPCDGAFRVEQARDAWHRANAGSQPPEEDEDEAGAEPLEDELALEDFL